QAMVDLAPPDSIARAWLVEDEVVIRGAARELVGVRDERPSVGEDAGAALQRRGIELGGRRVPDDGSDRFDAVRFEAALNPRWGGRHGSASSGRQNRNEFEIVRGAGKIVFPQPAHSTPSTFR